MSTANITRDEARARSEIVSARAYEVHVDLTGRDVQDPERQFVSTTRFSFDSAAGQTHLDLIADEIRAATLDGEPLDATAFDGYRVPLNLAEGEHLVEIGRAHV